LQAEGNKERGGGLAGDGRGEVVKRGIGKFDKTDHETTNE